MNEPLQTLGRRIKKLVARGTVKLINDALKFQELQIGLLAGETRSNVERIQQYGFTAHPLPGSEHLTLFLSGHRNHGITIAVDDRRYRVTGLVQGEVAIYDDQGQTIELKRDKILVTAPKVVVLSDDVHLGDEGGPQVARIGDMVQVTGGSSAGLHPIVQGSSKVRAVD